jgi:hypothetical protein
MPDTSVLRQQASFDEVDLQLAVRSMAAEARSSLSLTAPLPVLTAEAPDPVDCETHTARRGLLLPGSVLGLAAALLVVAVVWVTQQSASPPPAVAIPVGSMPAPVQAPAPVAPPLGAPPIVVEAPAAAAAPPVSGDPGPTVGMPQQRLRHLLTRLADRR